LSVTEQKCAFFLDGVHSLEAKEKEFAKNQLSLEDYFKPL